MTFHSNCLQFAWNVVFVLFFFFCIFYFILFFFFLEKYYQLSSAKLAKRVVKVNAVAKPKIL